MSIFDRFLGDAQEKKVDMTEEMATTVVLDEEDAEAFNQLQDLADRRGMQPRDMLLFMIRAFDKKPQVYDLGDTLGFGKYRGENVEDAIRMDPRYFAWLASESQTIVFSSEAQMLIAQMSKRVL